MALRWPGTTCALHTDARIDVLAARKDWRHYTCCVLHLAVLANFLECICGAERQSTTQGQERGVHRFLACIQNSNS